MGMDMNGYNRFDYASSEELINNYKKFFNKCDLCIEVGSLHGRNANQLSEELNITNVHIIEPNKYSYDIIVSRYPQYNCHQVAFGDKDAIVNFNAVIFHNPGVSSVMDRIDTTFFNDKIELMKVNMVRGDSFCVDNNINKIDIVKIDVEGFGYEVLIGFGDKLIDIKFIEIECETKIVWKEQKIFNRVNDFLISRGFKLIHDVNLNLLQFNAHYVNSIFLKD